MLFRRKIIHLKNELYYYQKKANELEEFDIENRDKIFLLKQENEELKNEVNRLRRFFRRTEND